MGDSWPCYIVAREGKAHNNKKRNGCTPNPENNLKAVNMSDTLRIHFLTSFSPLLISPVLLFFVVFENSFVLS